MCVCAEQGALQKIHSLEALRHHLTADADAAKQQVMPYIAAPSSLTALMALPVHMCTSNVLGHCNSLRSLPSDPQIHWICDPAQPSVQ